MTDWQQWHEQYRDPSSGLSQRLRAVQGQIRQVLDAAAAGPITVISACAGDGRDLLGVLADHPRRSDVRARLVEWDPVLADRARAADIPGVDVVTGDAASVDAYTGYVPADLVLEVGIFGNITDADIRATVEATPSLCAPGATVIWSRGRFAPDLVPQICDWYAATGFEEVFVSAADAPYGVGVHRYTGPPQAVVPGTHMFTFLPDT